MDQVARVVHGLPATHVCRVLRHSSYSLLFVSFEVTPLGGKHREPVTLLPHADRHKTLLCWLHDAAYTVTQTVTLVIISHTQKTQDIQTLPV